MATLIRGSRVLVLGASGGIGSAIADAFAAEGAEVARPRRAELDVTDDASVQAYFASAPVFDHLVVAAAQTKTGSVASLKVSDAQASMNSKFFGAYRVAKAARIVDRGSITFVSGFLSRRPSATSVLQGAINAALEALARGLALERAPVRVNTVSPGLIDTQLHDKMGDAAKQAMFKTVASRLPVRRIGHPTDVATAVMFLAANPFVTGSTVTVDGGGTIAG